MKDLQWQYEYQGSGLINLRILVCSVCIDEFQPQLLAPRIPPDPLPVLNPRPEPYATEEGGPPGPANPQINPFTQVVPGYPPYPSGANPPTPTPVPAHAMYDSSGNLMRDSSGNIMEWE